MTIGQWDREEAYTFAAEPNGLFQALTQAACSNSSIRFVTKSLLLRWALQGTASALSVTDWLDLTWLQLTLRVGSELAFGQQMVSSRARGKAVNGNIGNGYTATSASLVFRSFGFGAYKVNNGAMSYGHAS